MYLYHPPHTLKKWVTLEKLDWIGLSENSNAMQLLAKNQDKIAWKWLSQNPNATPLLEANPNKIVWYYLSANPNAIEILERNVDKKEMNERILKNVKSVENKAYEDDL